MRTAPIYLDNHATTRPDPRVLEAMWPYFTTLYGNAASASHSFGWEASEAVEKAREQVATLLGADDPREIIFTSGASEANNLALKGGLPSLRRQGNHVVTSAVEHKSVLGALKRLGQEGWDVTVVPVDEYGQVRVEAIEAALTDRTVLVSVIAANNEVGTINPLAAIGELCRERRVVLHSDATQAVGKIPLHVVSDGVALLSLTAHKFYGPKGIGALYARRVEPRVKLAAQIDGGGQERGLRGGTPAVPLIVGLGAACGIALEERAAEGVRVAALRDRLLAGIATRVEAVHLNGHPTERLPGNLNLSFGYVDGEALMMSMREIAVSSGSACTSANPEPSHVLTAMGLDEDLARASLRFGVGRFNTEAEIDAAVEIVVAATARLRMHSPAWDGAGVAGVHGEKFDEAVQY